jgi:hypothetical protein
MNHYHVGIVVTDIEEASARLSDMLGVTWGPIMALPAVDYRDESGADVSWPTTMRYSTGDPCLELILEVPGTIWVRNESSNLHHVGFWVEGLGETSASLSCSVSGWSSSTPLCVTGCGSCSSPRPALHNRWPGDPACGGLSLRGVESPVRRYRPGLVGTSPLLDRPPIRFIMLSCSYIKGGVWPDRSLGLLPLTST